MRYTYEHMKSMLQGAYKKLKSYYFYDKTLLFIKKKIAEFESDDGCFQQTFDVLAKALISENSAYFEELINQLDYRVFPKRLVAASAPTSTIVGTIDHHKNIAKVNFFIDVPIELLILDCLWTLCIAKISNKNMEPRHAPMPGNSRQVFFILIKMTYMRVLIGSPTDALNHIMKIILDGKKTHFRNYARVYWFRISSCLAWI